MKTPKHSKRQPMAKILAKEPELVARITRDAAMEIAEMLPQATSSSDPGNPTNLPHRALYLAHRDACVTCQRMEPCDRGAMLKLNEQSEAMNEKDLPSSAHLDDNGEFP